MSSNNISSVDTQEILFKKYQGYPNTQTGLSVSKGVQSLAIPYVPSKYIYNQEIPETAPVSLTENNFPYSIVINGTNEAIATSKKAVSTNYSHIVKYKDIVLTQTQESIYSFYFKGTNSNSVDIENLLTRIIPGNYDKTGSYSEEVKTSTGTVISSDKYILDRDAGLITFYGIGNDVNLTSLPTITFWRYEGTMGVKSNDNTIGITGTPSSTGEYIYWNSDNSSWTVGKNEICLGTNAGLKTNSSNINIGAYAGQINEGNNVIAIGAYSAQKNTSNNVIAIGAYSGQSNQKQNSIIINASGSNFPIENSNSFYVNPIRNDTSFLGKNLLYIPGTKEVVYKNNDLPILNYHLSGNIIVSGAEEKQLNCNINTNDSSDMKNDIFKYDIYDLGSYNKKLSTNLTGKINVLVSYQLAFDKEGQIETGIYTTTDNGATFNIKLWSVSDYAKGFVNSYSFIVSLTSATPIVIKYKISGETIYNILKDDTKVQFIPLSYEENGNTIKTFVIDHPIDNDKHLVHSCLEGPEAGVYYRGMSCIPENQNSVVISLPEYVSSFTTEPTPHITPIFNGKIRALNSSLIENNQFTVYGKPGEFSWIVYAKRQSIEVEPYKNNVVVRGEGPYKYI